MDDEVEADDDGFGEVCVANVREDMAGLKLER